MINTASLLIFALFTSAFTASAQNARLAGTWNLNLDRSKHVALPAGYQVSSRITPDAPTLQIVMNLVNPNGETRTEDWKLITNGRDYDGTFNGQPAQISARWDGDVLVNHIAYTMRDGAKAEVTRHLTLSGDGRTLTVNFTETIGGQAEEGLEIWTKQE